MKKKVNKKEISISVNNLHISYRGLKKFSIKKSLLKLKTSKREIFEALKGVSFEIEKGKILGIVGKNGSGKSTLLRSIAGIFSPDKGSINLHGNSISLLSIGVGFQPALTGYENIFLSGMLLGFSEDEVKEKNSDSENSTDFSAVINHLDNKAQEDEFSNDNKNINVTETQDELQQEELIFNSSDSIENDILENTSHKQKETIPEEDISDETINIFD